MHCIVCGSRRAVLVSKKLRDDPETRVVKCRQCGLIQADPLPDPAAERAFYHKDRQTKNTGRSTAISQLKTWHKNDTKRRAAFLAKILPRKARVLDVGSGYGFLLGDLRRRGFDAHGLEISAERRHISRRISKAPLIDTDIMTMTRRSRPRTAPFDAATLYHVLEHLRNPVEFMRRLRSLVKKGGHIIIEVPNAQDRALKANAAYRRWYWQKAHLAYFTPKTLDLVLKRAGFKRYTFHFEQRYSIKNYFHWEFKKTPQFSLPSYELRGSLSWLDRFYKHELIKRKIADTLTAVIVA